MATDDIQRVVTGTAPAPAIFTVPGNGQVRPKEIFATFDGSGAGSAFFPTMKIISDAGKVVGIHNSDTSVAAGASADVSWFPGVKAAAKAAAAGTVPSGYVARFGVFNFVVGTHVQAFNAGNLKTNDSTVWSVNGGTAALTCSHGGLLRTDIAMSWSTTGGGAMVGSFELRTDVFDSTSASVEGVAGGGAEYVVPEVYATIGGDAFAVNGQGLWNCDDTFYTPPYTIKYTIAVGSTNITATSTSLVGTILNPTGLT